MRVLLDACVLYPTVMREILIGVARAGLYQPFWSDRILEEWARAARKIGPEGEVIARGEIALLTSQYPHAAITPKTGDLARLWLPDEGDIHVLAAAVAGSADMILTLNAKDFPRGILEEEGLLRMAPDEFLMSLWPDHAAVMTGVARDVHKTAESLSGMVLEPRKLLKKARLPRFAKAISAAGL